MSKSPKLGRNYMPNTCVYSANNRFKRSDIFCVQQSTEYTDRGKKYNSSWAQVASNTKVVQWFIEHIPTGFLSYFNLLYTNFSPQSTAPIISNKKGNLKKGNKQWN